ncbi:hypothetical protein K7A41_00575 [Sphingobacterium sp. InxBP1]|uniref:hypothetical protein n=1 Tax=Sphingobacterium sp. InxBP1 TaxID=2870328 RepID=UPI0022436A63|nr:hypothetical protein [Sphingobacterium sp. InxBP1]MCW8309715.1 hypothetical protein [Sphingobacterium sp. InxBP1]
MKSKYLALILITLFISVVYSQETNPVPLQPQAAELYRYSSNQVSPLTGVPNIKIPLFSDKRCTDINLALSYNASGIKVNQVSTWVGLGWSLFGSGAISRTVRGLPDETPDYGYIDNPMTAVDIATSNSYDVLKRYAENEKDCLPDYFNLSLSGRSVTFIYRKSKARFEALTQDPIKIEWENSSIRTKATFKITDEFGKQYFFAQTDAVFDDANPIGTPISLRSYNQSWHLTTIISANKADTTNFKYERHTSKGYLKDFTEYRTYADNNFYLGGNNVTYNASFVNAGVKESTVLLDYNESLLSEIQYKDNRVLFYAKTQRKDFGKQLDSVIVLNGNKRLFKYEFQYGYFEANSAPAFPSEYRLKLVAVKKVSVVNPSDQETHTFEYDESVRLPSSDSKFQDYWGYYNGSNTHSLLPKIKPMHPSLSAHQSTDIGFADRKVSANHAKAGLLKKIFFPTGGYVEYSFESNKYLSDFTRSAEISIMEPFRLTATSMLAPVQYRKQFTIPPNLDNNGLGRLLITMSAHKGAGPFNLEDVQYINIRNVTQNRNIATYTHTTDFYNVKNIDVPLYLNAGDVYEVFASVMSEPSVSQPVYLTASLTASVKQTGREERDGGGLRIKNIFSYDQNNELLQSENYTYPLGNFLRGDRDFENNYIEKTEFVTDPVCAAKTALCFNCWVNTKTITYYASSSLPMINLEGATILYNSVTNTICDKLGNPSSKIVLSRSYQPLGHNSFYNPTVPGMREYVSDLILTAQAPSEYHYSYDSLSRDFDLVKAKIEKYETNYEGNEPVTFVFRRNFYNHSICTTTGTVFDPADFSHIQYNLHFGQFKLASTTIKEYHKGQEIISNTIKYFSDNPIHGQNTRIEHISSTNDKETEYITFPDDYSDGVGFLDQMKKKQSHLIAYPIERVKVREISGVQYVTQGEINTYKAGTKLCRDKHYILELEKSVAMKDYKFSNRVKGIVSPNGIASAFQPDVRYEKKVEYLSYDPFNNLQELLENGNMKTVYLWGYSGQYPIAEIKNATYVEVESVLTKAAIDNLNVATHSESTMETLIKGAADKLRAGLPNGMVTSYTYKPLVGMTSKTDARGITEYYKYDGMQRLQAILDHLNQVNKAFDYHYRPN